MDAQNRSLEFALALTLPAAIALAVAAEPIVRVLYERGAFTPEATPATAWALTAFAAGLPAFVLIKVFQPAFFAREDTRTPMWLAGVNMAVNVVGSLALFYLFEALGLMPHVGIAVATSVAGWVNALMLWIILARRGDFAWDRRLIRTLGGCIAASVAMGLAVWLALAPLAPYLASAAPLLHRIGALVLLVGCGLVVYFAAAVMTGAIRLDQIRRFVPRRRG